jgi:phage terminase small subunit
MAGVKGRSGGARPGAGRKPQTEAEKKTIATSGKQTPLEFLLSVMNDNDVEDKLRLEAAKTAAQYVHPKKGEGGKKDDAADRLKAASGGKFGVRQGPRLVASAK